MRNPIYKHYYISRWKKEPLWKNHFPSRQLSASRDVRGPAEPRQGWVGADPLCGPAQQDDPGERTRSSIPAGALPHQSPGGEPSAENPPQGMVVICQKNGRARMQEARPPWKGAMPAHAATRADPGIFGRAKNPSWNRHPSDGGVHNHSPARASPCKGRDREEAGAGRGEESRTSRTRVS